MRSFKELNIERKYATGKKNPPIDFYNLVIPHSKHIFFKLGYFSSYSISVLALPLTKFLLKGGTLNIITNHIYTEKDAENLLLVDLSEKKLWEIGKMFSNEPKEFRRHLEEGTALFYDCLNYLQKEDRLRIQPVLFGENYDLSHFKEFIAEDFDGNLINATGSCNMTANGILRNGESFMVANSWESNEEDLEMIKKEKEEIISILDNKNKDFHYAPKEQIIKVIKQNAHTRDLADLFDKAKKFRNKHKLIKTKNKLVLSLEAEFEEFVDKYLITPRRPSWFEPRDYQMEAFENWIDNDYSGVFAMATGTGKTLTSLNCVIKLYQKEQYYRVIILVPSIALLKQWQKEVEQFNFKNLLIVGGGNNWEKDLSNYVSNYRWGMKKDLFIITTYGSFVLDRFQKLYKSIQEDFLLIADEAHNMGAQQIQNVMSQLSVKRKIGLSATPKRIYDPEGTYAIDHFFNDSPPYTFNFGMEKALDYGFLTNYRYLPQIVELREEEFEEYVSISKRLLMYFDSKKGEFRNDPMVEILLLKRKNIIHKAKNKIDVFIDILHSLFKVEKDKYIFAYIPEGFSENDDGERERVMNQYIIRANKEFPDLKMNTYTSVDQNHEEILRGFSEGKIDILFAMKMLDEGVDVPRAEIGIFASSTGNPRQFIQRRGRLLRNHKDKAYSTIYDMIVVPKIDLALGDLFNVERNLVRNELNRVGYFASLSTNFYDSKEALNSVCKKYDLDLDTIINDL